MKTPPLSPEPTLPQIQTHLDVVCRANGWDKNSVPEVFLLLNEEIGELAKAIRKYTGFKGETKSLDKDNLEEEFADVLNYLLELANRFGVDLESVYRKKNLINETRSWE
jgi:NTP pyrophosphatase (non-canonical NTP hydrolase)